MEIRMKGKDKTANTQQWKLKNMLKINYNFNIKTGVWGTNTWPEKNENVLCVYNMHAWKVHWFCVHKKSIRHCHWLW